MTTEVKDYLRGAFLNGTLDVTASYEAVRGFVQIFAGEDVAKRAIEQCQFLSSKQLLALRKLAKST